MKLKEFNYIMTHDEFGNKDITNNYYILFGLMLLYVLFVIVGGMGWLMYLSHFL